MQLVAEEIKEKLNLSVGDSDVQIVITNNILASSSHIFETDGLYIITFNSAKINNEKELSALIKVIRNKIGGIDPLETITHNNVKRLVEKMYAPIQEPKKKAVKKTKTKQPKKAAVKKEKVIKPIRNKTTKTKRGRPAGSKNKSKK